ncbi:hypothetical protein MN032_11150 [Agromyces atrinae]|uniref:phage tail protein n=1 Tax=Agromyces atrinae TaxID=592376 RepID=UPI001F57DC09|nr:hypothetical protein [Agromyces atrinae]MCI2958255.1 hypothetical protein [Agromyces atrinae]
MSVNVGKSVGRVSIRALPDTRTFRRDLLDKLRRIEKTTSISVMVDRANVDRRKIRASIETKLKDLDGIHMDADVAVTIDRAKLKKVELRKSIQEQFDKLENVQVKIAAEIANEDHFERQVDQMVRKASRKQVKIPVAAQTAAATAQMRWLSRDRIVNLIPKVSQAAAVKAATMIAALSGARVASDWIERLSRNLADLDKSLPSISLWTSGLTSLFALLTSGISGIVGVGQGLFSILPALLTVPGLILNSVASITVLIVALKHAKDELGVLSNDMNELGGIIRSTFWERARQPIIDLVQGLMPQLRAAFISVSEGVGDFTAAMSNAFARELGEGRLLSIFDHIAEGWRILATGADGFAGALVSLSQIAARYTPRLASWFVRQANTFDAWLEQISNDGRLERWMEDAIDGMYQLWDATRGIAGVFRGLWRAASAAGSTGLKGFSETMLAWSRVANSPAFQKGLTAIFAGSGVATAAFGQSLRDIGWLLHDLSDDVEVFIGVAGRAFAGLISDVANAFNTPTFGRAIRKLAEGLEDGLSGFGDYLPGIEDAVSSLLSFIGEFARQVGPVLGAALDAFGGFLEPVLTLLETKVLPVLGPMLRDAIDRLGPKLADMGEKFGPLLEDLTSLAEDVFPLIEAAISGIADGINSALDGYNTKMPNERGDGDFFTRLGEGIKQVTGALEALFDAAEGQNVGVKALAGEYGVLWAEIANGMLTLINGVRNLVGQTVANVQAFFAPIVAFVTSVVTALQQAVANLGLFIGDGLRIIVGLFTGNTDLIARGVERFGGRLGEIWAGISGRVTGAAQGLWANVTQAFANGVVNAVGFVVTLPDRMLGIFSNLAARMYGVGRNIIQGLVDGIGSMVGEAAAAARRAAEGVLSAAKGFLGINSPSRRFRVEVGRMVPRGLALGVLDGIPKLKATIRDMVKIPDVSFGAAMAAFGGAGAGSSAGNFTLEYNVHGTEGMQRDELFGAAAQLRNRVGK